MSSFASKQPSSSSSKGNQKKAPPMSEETFQDIMQGLSRANDAANERGKDKDLVLVLGNTGAGKSTFVNYIMDLPMREETVPSSLEKGFVCDNAIMKIGHGFESMTDFPESCCDKRTNITYCDCPGFMDNRGVIFDITNMYAITKMAQSARSVKGVVIIFNYHALLSDRARGLREMACLLDTIFDSKAAVHRSSVMLLVSRVPSDVALGDLRNFLSKAVQSEVFTHSDDSYQLFKYLASNCEFYDPLDRYCDAQHSRLSRKALVEKFKTFSGIPHHSLNVGLSHEAVNTLSSLLSSLYEAAKEHFLEQDISRVQCFLTTVEGLRVLRNAVVEQCHADFMQFMITQLHAWSAEHEMLATIQDIGVQLPLHLGEQVDAIVSSMVKEIEEKKAMGEKIDVMESKLDLARKDIEAKKLQTEHLEEENKAAKVKSQQQADQVKKLQEDIEKSKAEANKLRDELSRPKASSGLNDAILSQLLSQAFSSGGGMMGDGWGGGLMGMNRSFDGMSLSTPRTSRASSSGGRRCADGSLDMRCRENKGRNKWG